MISAADLPSTPLYAAGYQRLSAIQFFFITSKCSSGSNRVDFIVVIEHLVTKASYFSEKLTRSE